MASAFYTPHDVAGETVLITGASSGIGLATAWRFAELGSKLVIVARRLEKLEELKAEIVAKFPAAEVHCARLDVGDIAGVEAFLPSLPAGFNQIDVLVNNAGLALGKSPADETATSDTATMIQTNVTGMITMFASVASQMRARSKGHLINIGSVSGHEVYPGGAVYCASKHAVTAYTMAARHDLVATPVRVTLLSPGFVQTEFSNVRFKGDDKAADAVYEDFVPLYAQDIADNIVYSATRPAHVQIADIITWPTNQSGTQNLARVGPSLGAAAL